MVLGVNIEDLTAVGIAVTNHGEDLAAKHAAADSSIEAAQTGWQGASASALATKSAACLQTTSTLLIRMSDHAQGLHTSAHGFSEHEAQSSQALDAVAQSADAIAGQTAD
jgi:uncharacterized protein YukE